MIDRRNAPRWDYENQSWEVRRGTDEFEAGEQKNENLESAASELQMLDNEIQAKHDEIRAKHNDFVAFKRGKEDEIRTMERKKEVVSEFIRNEKRKTEPSKSPECSSPRAPRHIGIGDDPALQKQHIQYCKRPSSSNAHHIHRETSARPSESPATASPSPRALGSRRDCHGSNNHIR